VTGPPTVDSPGRRDPATQGTLWTMKGQGIADAVVVAAGRSRRMGSVDKLAALVAGRPVLRWAVESLAASPEVADVIVVTTAERDAELRAADWLQGLRARTVIGGERRQDSVAAGVRAATADVVLVHDAARPFVSRALIARVVAGACEHGAVIPALPVVDALKRVEEGRISASAPRDGLFRAQTPQAARRELLLAACDAHAGGPDDIPDEADLLARHGVPVRVVEGEAGNIKVTRPEDLEVARQLAGAGTRVRLGLGTDSHPFGPHDGLRLGGLLIEGAPRLQGHSDGDVLLHALCDGALGAASLGDLGRVFPSDQAATRGIDSRALVAEVVARVGDAGLVIDAVDATLLGARPRFGARRLDEMAASLAALTGAAVGRVSVKASTGNLSGDEGAGRVISATCLVSLVPR
jgi:2-C-methyl-D-erythritol 4-phosphate cytidylyltransferase/2-C-methyl-D-erythritol 2,4-cyclodiphosphate synthase